MGARFGRRLHIIMAILGFWWIVKIRLIDLFPCDFFAGVTGELSHDGYHRAARHVVAVIDRFAGADRLEKNIMLDLVRIASSVPSPVCLAPYPASRYGSLAFAAEYGTGRIVVASGRRPA